MEGGATTQFLYDGNELVAEYNGSGTLLRRYVHGRGLDQPLVRYEGTGVTTPIWFHADQLGSVIATTGSAGTATIYAYSATGEPSGGSWTGPRFRYTGQIAFSSNAAVHLYYYKARLYDPSLGRFLQTDPIGYGGGLNLYAYAANDPVNSTDPLGLLESVTVFGDKWKQQVGSTAAPPSAVPGQAEEPDRAQDIGTSNERKDPNKVSPATKKFICECLSVNDYNVKRAWASSDALRLSKNDDGSSNWNNPTYRQGENWLTAASGYFPIPFAFEAQIRLHFWLKKAAPVNTTPYSADAENAALNGLDHYGMTPAQLKAWCDAN